MKKKEQKNLFFQLGKVHEIRLCSFVMVKPTQHILEEGMATQSIILAWRTSMDRGAWWAAVHGVLKSRTQLSY